MSGGTQTSTSQSTTTPFPGAEKLLNTGLTDALKLYQGGYGSQPYTGSTVVPYSRQTQRAMQGMMDYSGGSNLTRNMNNIMNNGGFTGVQSNALNNMQGDARQANNYADRMMQSGGFTQAQRRALGSAVTGSQQADNLANQMMRTGGFNANMRDAMGNIRGASDAATRYAGQMMQNDGLSAAQQQALKNSQAIANSQFDYSPDFDNVLQDTLGDARGGVNMNAAAAGRYGSGVHQGKVASELGQLSSQMRLGEYKDWQNRKSSENQNVFGMGQTGQGNINNALGLQGSLGQAYMNAGQMGINNQQNALGLRSNMANSVANMGQMGVNNVLNSQSAANSANNNVFNAGQTGIGNMSSAYDIGMKPYQTQMQVGGMYEDLAGRQLNDKLRIWQETQNAPWDGISKLMNTANLTGQYASRNTTSQMPGQNPFLTALGIGTGGLGLMSAWRDFNAPAGTGGGSAGYY